MPQRCRPLGLVSSLLCAVLLASLGGCGGDQGTPPEPILGSASGEVLVEGSGLAGVTVTISGPSTNRSAVTSTNGSFRFDVLGEGTYVISLSSLPDGTSFSSAQETISITEAAPDVAILFEGEFLRQSSISVLVEAELVPVRGITVEIQGPDGAQQADTDPQGQTLFTELLTGSYQVRLVDPPVEAFDFPVTDQPIELAPSDQGQIEFSGTSKLAVNTAPLPVAKTEEAYTFQFEASGGYGDGGYTFYGENLPNGMSLATDGELSGSAPADPGAYTFTVGVRNDGRSAEREFELQVATPPEAPSDVRAVSLSSSEIEITWTDNSADETHFLIRRTELTGLPTAPSPAWPTLGAGAAEEEFSVESNETAWIDTGLRPGVLYRYEVIACNLVCNGNPDEVSSEGTATATTEPPSDAVLHSTGLSVAGPGGGHSVVDIGLWMYGQRDWGNCYYQLRPDLCWVVSADAADWANISDWLGNLWWDPDTGFAYRLLEPINVVWVDFSADGPAEAEQNVVDFLDRCGLASEPNDFSYPFVRHSQGYQATFGDPKTFVDHEMGDELTTFVDQTWPEANNHGRVFGPHQGDGPYPAFFHTGAFSAETEWDTEEDAGHEFNGFNIARDRLKAEECRNVEWQSPLNPAYSRGVSDFGNNG